jgi:minor tail protein
MAAGNAIIGALRAVLGIDTAQFETGLKSAQGSLSGFGVGIAGVAGAAAAAFATIGTAMGVALKSTINDMDHLNKTSQKLGIPVEQLSSLAYAADLSDVSFEALSKGVGKLSKAMVEAAGKPTSDAANAFRALGVSTTDANGKLKSSEVVMGDLAAAFEGLKDGPGKTAVAMALFGKAGADLIPLLNGGRDGLKEMNDEAKAFGAVVSGTAAKQAEAFNDNMTRLGYAVKGVIVQVAERLLPILVDVSTKMVEAAKNSSALELVVSALSASMKLLVTSGVLVSATMQVLGDTLSIIWGGLARLIKGDVAGAFEHLKTKAGDIAATASSTMATLDGVWKGAQAGAQGSAAATDEATRAQKDFNFAALAGKNAVDQFIDSQKKGLAGQEAEIKTFGLLAGAREAAKLQLQAEAIAAANRTAISPAQQAALDLEKQKASDYAMTLAGLQMTQANLTPAQAFQLEQQKIQGLFDAGKLSAEAYGQAMDNAAQRANATWAQAGESIAGSFQQIGQAFAKESKSMALVAKIAGIVQATISMFTGAAKALELPFPANIAAAAAVLAKGAALVASIKGTSVGGFATGGSLTVPGGSGGGDSVRAMVDLQPGEQLDIWKPGEGPGDPRRGAGGGGGTSVVELRGLSAIKRYTIDEIKMIVEGLNEALPYGVKINMAPA